MKGWLRFAAAFLSRVESEIGPNIGIKITDPKLTAIINVSILMGYGFSKSIFSLKDNEGALIVHQDKVKRFVIGEGRHIYYPLGNKVIKFNLNQKSVSTHAYSVDKNNEQAIVSTVVLYHLDPKGLQSLYSKLGANPKPAIKELITNATKTVLKNHTGYDLVVTLGKNGLAREIFVELKKQATVFDVTVDGVQVIKMVVTI